MLNSNVEDIDIKWIFPEYDPVCPLDNDLPDEDQEGTDDDGKGHAAPEDDENRDLPSGI
ncbi:hypothetical protein ARMGADRAFT_1090462 [Armillaria gallica]|uniref:Uncharacterized protein n=1 Tax=Armillaria gallica TaxID=47427 RepID=A0A2H3CH98_ARMGA|nr:hypothetical protein ARMGADRAFT_1090462 [Armillaria gallica]